MRPRGWCALALLLAGLYSASAAAYVPPIYYQVKKITDGREPFRAIVAFVSVYKPGDGRTTSDQLIYEDRLPYVENQKTQWPLMPLSFEAQPQTLFAAWRSFGLTASAEKDLAERPFDPKELKAGATYTNPQQLLAKVPQPYYKMDSGLALRRYGNRYAFVSAEENVPLAEARSIWIDRRTFAPIAVRGPCPSEVGGLSWASGGKDTCEVAMDRGVGITKSAGDRPKNFMIKKGGENVLLVRLDRVVVNPQEATWKDILAKRRAAESAASGHERDARNVVNALFQ